MHRTRSSSNNQNWSGRAVCARTTTNPIVIYTLYVVLPKHLLQSAAASRSESEIAKNDVIRRLCILY